MNSSTPELQLRKALETRRAIRSPGLSEGGRRLMIIPPSPPLSTRTATSIRKPSAISPRPSNPMWMGYCFTVPMEKAPPDPRGAGRRSDHSEPPEARHGGPDGRNPGPGGHSPERGRKLGGQGTGHTPALLRGQSGPRINALLWRHCRYGQGRGLALPCAGQYQSPTTPSGSGRAG